MNFFKVSAFAIATIAITGTPEIKAGEDNNSSKWYVTGSAGLSNPGDIKSKRDNFTLNGNSVSIQYLLEHDDAAEYSIGAGYFLSPETRLELNYLKSNYDLTKVGFNGTLSGTSAEVMFRQRTTRPLTASLFPSTKTFHIPVAGNHLLERELVLALSL